MIVVVEKAFFHCGKCMTRSKLWDYARHLEQADAPSSAALAL